ncbi:MAG: hypothetical protein MPK11_04660 [Gammaproteobacteria bacterium]|nr:hypothetical protein [Gammaproteobacteria bacterium]CAJ2377584.1 MAG: hypothetical protein IBGAMO2_820022 [Arenicellales bacterium IbO2]MDA7962730.1 hypothetical protein [Gammaproteobacteria bacterium]MDA7970051.1 hypothetical protein [Gammaproteobacteria bacterium]MDA7995363.1 hypothetical protein [Gammaproteobacteria bacterium]
MKFWDREQAAQLARRIRRALRRGERRAGRRRKAIAENLAGDAFARLWRRTPLMPAQADQKKFQDLAGRREVETPVAVMPDELSAEGRNDSAWLSQQTIGKIKARHPHVSPADILLVQKAVDGADVFYQGGGRWTGFTHISAEKPWAIGWKRTAGGKIYITTFHRAQPAQLQQAEKKWRKVKK